MNILFMPSWFETDEDINSGVFFSEQAKELKLLGNSVTIAIVDILNYPYKSSYPKYRIIQESRYGLDIYRIMIPSLMTGHIPKIFYSYYRYYYNKLYMFMLSKGLQFDIIYAHSFWHAGYIGIFIKNEYGIPLIIQEHRSMLITGEFGDNVNPYLKKAVLESDAFFSVSNRLRDNIYMRTGLSDGIDVMPNMVDDLFQYRPLCSKKFTYTFIGTLNDNKRIINLLECFEHLCGKYSGLHLNIAGDGPLAERVKEIVGISDLLKKSVTICGFLSRDEVFELLGETNVLVLPSAFETFGIVCIEAMAVGRPVICTRNGSVDFMNDDTGIMVDVDSYEQLISAMESMYLNYEYYDLQKISEYCRKKYSAKVVMSKLMTRMMEISNAYKK